MAGHGEIAVEEERVSSVESRLERLEERARDIAATTYVADLSVGRGAMALVEVGVALTEFSSALADAIQRTRVEVAAARETFVETDEGVSAAIDIWKEG